MNAFSSDSLLSFASQPVSQPLVLRLWVFAARCYFWWLKIIISLILSFPNKSASQQFQSSNLFWQPSGAENASIFESTVVGWTLASRSSWMIRSQCVCVVGRMSFKYYNLLDLSLPKHERGRASCRRIKLKHGRSGWFASLYKKLACLLQLLLHGWPPFDRLSRAISWRFFVIVYLLEANKNEIWT